MYGAYMLCMHTLRPRTTCVVGNPYISSELLEAIRSSIHPELIWTSSANELLEMVRTKLVNIEDVRVQHKGSGCAVVRLMSSGPYARINDRFVVTNTGKLVSHTAFTPQSLASLPLITCYDTAAINNAVTGKAAFPTEYLNFLKELPKDFFNTYRIVIQDKTLIKLVGNHTPITIFAWYKTCFSEKLQQAITTLVARATHLSQQAMYKQKKWCIDVRMTKKLILMPV